VERLCDATAEECWVRVSFVLVDKLNALQFLSLLIFELHLNILRFDFFVGKIKWLNVFLLQIFMVLFFEVNQLTTFFCLEIFVHG